MIDAQIQRVAETRLHKISFALLDGVRSVTLCALVKTNQMAEELGLDSGRLCSSDGPHEFTDNS